MGLLDQKNVFVKYLPSDVSDANLYALFEPFGEIVSAKVMVDHHTGASLGYGFVRYENPQSAQLAIATMTGQKVENKTLLCKLSNCSVTGIPDPSTNLYIKPLLPHITEDDLRHIFERFGPVHTCKVMVDRITGLSRQIGFESLAHATAAIHKMNGFKMADNAPPLVVKYAESEHQKAFRKARVQLSLWGRGSSPNSDRSTSPPSPSGGYFDFSQMQAALYGLPYVPPGYVSFAANYPYVGMTVSAPRHPLWRPPPYLMNSEGPRIGEIGQH